MTDEEKPTHSLWLGNCFCVYAAFGSKYGIGYLFQRIVCNTSFGDVWNFACSILIAGNLFDGDSDGDDAVYRSDFPNIFDEKASSDRNVIECRRILGIFLCTVHPDFLFGSDFRRNRKLFIWSDSDGTSGSKLV